jgi:gluconolactonase
MEASPELFVKDLTTPYGVAFDMDDNLLIGEDRPGRIQKVTPDGDKSLFIQFNGQPLGLAVDDSNDLFAALGNRHQLSIVSPEQETAVYAHSCNGRRFAGPRALCFSPTGSLLFSDDDGTIYSADIEGEVHKLASGLDAPNGLIYSEDAGSLYVVESGKNRIVSLEVADDDTLGDPKEFYAFSDGGPPHSLLFDTESVLYVTRDDAGLSRINPDGQLIDTLAMPGPRPQGMTFGGIDYDELFIAEAENGCVYRLKLDHAGQRPFAGPRAI